MNITAFEGAVIRILMIALLVQTAPSANSILQLLKGDPAAAIQQLTTAIDSHSRAVGLFVFRSAAYFLNRQRDLAFADLNHATTIITADRERCVSLMLVPGFPGEIDSALPLYEQPNIYSTLIASLPPDTVFTVRSPLRCTFETAWVEVEYDNLTGWLTAYSGDETYAHPLPVESNSSTVSTDVPPICSGTPVTEVNLRTGAGTSFAIGRTLRPLQRIELVARRENDFFTWYQTPEGLWVREDVVSLAGACDTLPLA